MAHRNHGPIEVPALDSIVVAAPLAVPEGPQAPQAQQAPQAPQ